MQPGAAPGNLRIYWQDTIPENRKDFLFIPKTQNFSFLRVTSFRLQNSNFQLLNGNYGEIQGTAGNSLGPARNARISLALANLSQLGDNVGIQQIRYWKSTT